MALESPIAAHRTAAFRDILSKAFRAFPARVTKTLKENGWETFEDFMAGVERAGRIYLKDEKPSELVIRNQGESAEATRMLQNANSRAMFKLLATAFTGEADEAAAREALGTLGIDSWYRMSMKTVEPAMRKYFETTGRLPTETVKPATRLLMEMTADLAPAKLRQVVETFGISSPEHLTALYSAFVRAEILFDELDAAAGNFEMVTRLVNRSPSNPSKGIVFGVFGDQTRMIPPSLSGAGRLSYAEELVAQGLAPIRNNAEAAEAFRKWGLPNSVARPGTGMENFFKAGHSDVATVYVDDDQAGRMMAVDIRRQGNAKLAGILPEDGNLVMVQDLDAPHTRPGRFVSVLVEDWTGAKPVIEGWRGPQMESEEFARSRLSEVQCSTVFQDIAGFWDCIPKGMRVY